MANEKAKKDKWYNEKTSQIREITIKGLEPELERIYEKHRQDI